jgi:hypothetical protein
MSNMRAAISTISGNAPPRFNPRAFPYWKREFSMYCMGKNAAELALRNVRPIQGGTAGDKFKAK